MHKDRVGHSGVCHGQPINGDRQRVAAAEFSAIEVVADHLGHAANAAIHRGALAKFGRVNRRWRRDRAHLHAIVVGQALSSPSSDCRSGCRSGRA